MIDFRYHLVSIVSIFLALAVGILLGAGPLQEDLGKTLSNQVSTLRKEKDALRTQLDAAQARVDASDKFVTAVSPTLTESRLGGRSAVVVTLPGTDASLVTGVTKALTSSGATVSGTVEVDDAWSDPTKRSFRDQLLSSLAPLVGLDETSGSLENRMGALLARALVVNRVSDADQPSTSATQALAGLKEAGLLSFEGDGPTPATLAVVVAPSPSDKLSSDQREANLAAWVSIATQLDAASNGAVVVGDESSVGNGGLVRAVRADDVVATKVSTVDDIAAAMGRIALVYALRQQMAGEAGQYGTGDSAGALLPPLTASAS
ncbi:MAG TPA: copper transporter [Actinomycetales bacterium]|nr:copper transporter [Actinomycetales bacterium]